MSLDTSTTSSGYAVFSDGRLEKHGCIKHGIKNTETRVNKMVSSLIYLLQREFPTTIAIEKPPYKNDPSTLIYLSEIIGAVRAWSLSRGADYVEYAPSTWRRLVKSEEEKVPRKRELCKTWGIAKVNALFGVEVNDDEADAILIGYARVCSKIISFPL